MYVHHSLQKKLKVIKMFNQGYSCMAIVKRLRISDNQVRKLIYRYQDVGITGVQRKPILKLTDELKTELVQKYLDKSLSCEQISAKYGISTTSIYWLAKKVNQQEFSRVFHVSRKERLQQKMGRPKKKEPETELEKVLLENERLRAENALLKKVKALVLEREARLRKSGQKPSMN